MTSTTFVMKPSGTSSMLLATCARIVRSVMSMSLETITITALVSVEALSSTPLVQRQRRTLA